MPVMRSRTETISIVADPDTTYDFMVDPANLPQWAPGFAQDVHESPRGWIVDPGERAVRIDFQARNNLGVADHWVTIQPGVVVHNAVRVVPNGDGSEVIFTFFQTPDLTDADFEEAAALVAGDLLTLKRALERSVDTEEPS